MNKQKQKTRVSVGPVISSGLPAETMCGLVMATVSKQELERWYMSAIKEYEANLRGKSEDIADLYSRLPSELKEEAGE